MYNSIQDLNKITRKGLDSLELKILKLTPDNSLLREFILLPDINEKVYFGIFVMDFNEQNIKKLNNNKNGEFQIKPYSDCLSQIMGQSLFGNYYAFIYKNDSIKSICKIPTNDEYELKNNLLELCLYNTIENNCENYENRNLEYNIRKQVCEKKSSEIISKTNILIPYDCTGDGIKNEFIFLNGEACGFYRTTILGYDSTCERILMYPILDNNMTLNWNERFNPIGGTATIEFLCGDHGNETYEKTIYKFNKQKYVFEKILYVKKECN